MTRKFRLGLLVSVAAALGLHLRPCWTCCWTSSCGEAAGAEVSGTAGETRGSAARARDRVTASAADDVVWQGARRQSRPVLRSMWRSANPAITVSGHGLGTVSGHGLGTVSGHGLGTVSGHGLGGVNGHGLGGASVASAE